MEIHVPTTSSPSPERYNFHPMKRSQRIVFLLLSCGVFVAWLFLSSRSKVEAAAASAKADFFVAPNGNDKWSGTLEAPNAGGSDGPFATLERAQKAVRDTKKRNVMLRGGTYYLRVPWKLDRADSGSNNSPVVYQAYPGEKPIISGGRLLTGWTNSGNAWSVKLSSNDYKNFEALFFNDERRYRPRIQEDGYLYIERPVILQEKAQFCDQHPLREGELPPGAGQHRQGGPGGGGGGGGRRRFPGGPMGGPGMGRGPG